MTRRGLEANKGQGIFASVDQEPPKPEGNYQPVFFSRPKAGEKFEDWVDGLIDALDKKGIFDQNKKAELKDG